MKIILYLFISLLFTANGAAQDKESEFMKGFHTIVDSFFSKNTTITICPDTLREIGTLYFEMNTDSTGKIRSGRVLQRGKKILSPLIEIELWKHLSKFNFIYVYQFAMVLKKRKDPIMVPYKQRLWLFKK